jgi:hypothetical protein
LGLGTGGDEYGPKGAKAAIILRWSLEHRVQADLDFAELPVVTATLRSVLSWK